MIKIVKRIILILLIGIPIYIVIFLLLFILILFDKKTAIETTGLVCCKIRNDFNKIFV